MSTAENNLTRWSQRHKRGLIFGQLTFAVAEGYLDLEAAPIGKGDVPGPLLGGHCLSGEQIPGVLLPPNHQAERHLGELRMAHRQGQDAPLIEALASTIPQSAPRPRPFADQEIMDVAANLFAANGYHGTSVRDLSEALGLGKASLHHHEEFPA